LQTGDDPQIRRFETTSIERTPPPWDDGKPRVPLSGFESDALLQGLRNHRAKKGSPRWQCDTSNPDHPVGVAHHFF